MTSDGTSSSAGLAWHAESAEVVLAALASDAEAGLSDAVVRRRQARYGANAVITSYSIHYTKLYEFHRMSCRPPPGRTEQTRPTLSMVGSKRPLNRPDLKA